MFLGWIPSGFLIFIILRTILPKEMLFYSIFIVVILWAVLSFLVDGKLSRFHCPRCEKRYFKKGLFPTLRSNCSYCGLRINESKETEGEIQENPEPEFDTSIGQFITPRIFGSIFFIGGVFITIKGLLSLVVPDMTVTVNGIESTNIHDKMIITLFGFAILIIGCVFAIFPVKIVSGLNRKIHKVKTKMYNKSVE